MAATSAIRRLHRLGYENRGKQEHSELHFRANRIHLANTSRLAREPTCEPRRPVKSVEELQSLADAERYLRELGGLSRSHAVAFVSRVKRIALGQ